jgi:hypothetical protein
MTAEDSPFVRQSPLVTVFPLDPESTLPYNPDAKLMRVAQFRPFFPISGLVQELPM